MSSKEDLKIQADDITVVQGEKVKDYNVIVTSLDDAPLSGIPVTIAFYNNDYSFERGTITNQYGVAKVPIYLSGDAWFVDVHFKGNEQYKPQVVTKKIIIENFERLDSYITSENLVINIDEQSMNGTYYTITLLDSYDRPIINEPISIKVEQTGVDEPQTYVDVILKTDYNGKIKLPFLSYNENVKITSEYKGCTRFKPTINADIVAFADVEPRNTIEFQLCKLSDYGVVDYDRVAVEYRIGTGSWDLFLDEDKPYLDVIISEHYDNNANNRGSYRGWAYFDSLGTGVYEITISYDGMSSEAIGDFSNTYPFCRTFTFENTNDTRKTLTDFVASQGGWAYASTVSIIKGNVVSTQPGKKSNVGWYARLRVDFGFEVPSNIMYVGLNGNNTSTSYPQSFSELEQYCNEVISVVPYDYVDDGGITKSYVEVDIVVPSIAIKPTYGKQLMVYFLIQNNDFISQTQTFMDTVDIVETGNRDNTTITQTGFGYNGQTYQNIDVTVSNSNASMHEKVNDFYVMRLLNTGTQEEFYFYSYLADNITPSHNKFELAIGHWVLYIVSSETENYNGSTYTTTVNITTDTPIVPPQDNIITSAENYIDLGTDTPTFVDDIITTATTDDDIHSIMALEFTNSNYYRLSFNAQVTGDTAIVYGADPTLETMDGLFINNDSITLYNDGIEMDKLIFDTPIFNQTINNILFQRYGNQFTIFVNDEQVYKTELLSWNTFGVYQNATGSEMTLSYFALEPYITTEITPSVADYDGTTFGSNIHLEIDDNKLNMIDYGMLPSGAIGGGKIILNDVPLESANNYAIQLEMKYNNTRFERLNNLTGQMQMRVYEDILSTGTVKDYEKTLCSPMPVPNSRTVFTRHSDEGILYFVQDPLNANSSFLTNAYNQYKGGVEITTETGISLFNLDNAYSQVYVGNELVRAEFHRRSGFIKISRYDETSGDWATVNTFKLRNYPQLSLNHYNDDYAEIQFGNTTWKFYRGRPFIVLNHSQDDLRIMNLVDRVYCETVENQRGMGFIVDQNPNEQTTVTDENGTVLGYYSTFNPQLSIQQFKQELHIGENIRLDNFELYEADSNQNIGDVATNSQLGILNIDNDNALQIYKEDTDLALNFPSYSSYVERVNDTFTLSIDYLDCPFENIKVKARGFDEKGAVPVKDNIQYGIWEQTVTVEVDTTAIDSVRATFTGCPSEVKYLDFVIYFTGANSADIILKDLMYYDGDAILNHDIDTSRAFAEQVTINFADTYFANIYNDKDNCGLCIARPNQEPFTLTSLKASSETVLIPYMKKATEWDKPQQVFLEYLNAKQQVIDIDWEN